jgi:predicted MFS family arabinose efflux permease
VNTAAQQRGPSTPLIATIAVATALIVANLYYAQPLISVIAPDLGIAPDMAGSVTSVTQIGYGLGLFLLVSLADLVEHRRLVLIQLLCTAAALLAVALSRTAPIYYAAALSVGLFTTGAQVLLPYIAQLVPEERRGRVVGTVMAGLLTGLMLARPAALFVSAAFGWRAVFMVAAGVMVVLTAVLARMMPRHQPAGGLHYGQILLTSLRVLRDMPRVRRRAVYQTLMFAGFCLFWTAAPLALAERFALHEHGIALFALAGAGGALVAPWAGHLADSGLTRAATTAAMAVLGVAFVASGWLVAAGYLAAFALVAVLVDAAVQVNHVVGQRIIYTTPAAIRGRVNAIYMTVTFVGGAAGSMLGALTYHHGGWGTTALTGAAIGALLLVIQATEPWS